MSKKKKTTAALVATLNKQYKAIERNLRTINRKGETTDCIGKDLQNGNALSTAFDKTLSAIKAAGETVNFDTGKGEYFVGANKYRIEFRVVSVGCVEIEAPTEQIALVKAEKLAENDEIDLIQVSGTLVSVTEAV